MIKAGFIDTLIHIFYIVIKDISQNFGIFIAFKRYFRPTIAFGDTQGYRFGEVFMGCVQKVAKCIEACFSFFRTGVFFFPFFGAMAAAAQEFGFRTW